jgi:hypothetical protein
VLDVGGSFRDLIKSISPVFARKDWEILTKNFKIEDIMADIKKQARPEYKTKKLPFETTC